MLSRGSAARPLRVAVLCSKRAPGLERLLRGGPGRGFRVVAGLTSESESDARAAFERAGLPFLAHDLRRFHAERGAALGDRETRRAYDRRTVELLAAHAPDAIALSSYLYVLTQPVLEAWPERVVNVHDADLTIRDPDGRPRYRGLRSTRDAVAAGETETRSTVHLVNEGVDTGPPLVRSWAFPVHPLTADARRWGAEDVLGAYAYAQREWMMRASWGPLLERALERIARGQVRLLGGRAVVAGALGPEDLAPGGPAELVARDGTRP